MRTFAICLGVIGQALILIIFLFALKTGFFGSESIKWLDFAVISIIYWMWMINILVKPVRFSDPAQKAIGGLGIRWSSCFLYSIFAAGVIILGIGSRISFTWQIILQSIILFFFLMMLLQSSIASAKVGRVYEKEQQKKAGKFSIKASLNEILYKAEDSGAASEIIAKLKDLSAETRFLSPSVNPEALRLDSAIEKSCKDVLFALSDPEMNRAQINQSIDQIGRDLKRRKTL